MLHASTHTFSMRRAHNFVAVVMTFLSFREGATPLVIPQRLVSVDDIERSIFTVIAAAIFALSDPSTASAAQVVEWNLGNGVVRLPNPLMFPQQNPLQRPQLVGSGGGGAVFSFDESKTVVKVSWLASTESVERECSVLKTLENRAVEGVERCLGQARYPDDKRRVMIALEPLVEDAVASPMEIEEALRPHAVQCIIRTTVQMLAANIVTVDVQPLISKQSGDVVFIDLTEAQELRLPLSFLDVALLSSFCTEMAALIPESLLPVASTALLQELNALQQRGLVLSNEAYDALRGQPFISDEADKCIDEIVSEAT